MSNHISHGRYQTAIKGILDLSQVSRANFVTVRKKKKTGDCIIAARQITVIAF